MMQMAVLFGSRPSILILKTCIFVPISIEYFCISIIVNYWSEFTVFGPRCLIRHCELLCIQLPVWTALITGETLSINSFYFGKELLSDPIDLFLEIGFPPRGLVIFRSYPTTSFFVNSVDIIC